MAESAEQILEALELPDEQLWRMARRARERTLDQHTVDDRARDLVDAIAAIRSDDQPPASDAARPVSARASSDSDVTRTGLGA